MLTRLPACFIPLEEFRTVCLNTTDKVNYFKETTFSSLIIQELLILFTVNAKKLL